MRLTYFVNLYPAVSHTFIRREIAVLERCGAVVQRLSLRGAGSSLVDPADQEEARQTTSLLEMSKLRLLTSLLKSLAACPTKALSTLFWSLHLARRSGVRKAKMLAYLAEGALLAEACRAHGSALLRVHFGTNGAVVARLARRLGGPPFSIAYHGPDEFDAPARWDIEGVVEEAEFATAISSYCRAQLMRWTKPQDWPRIEIVRCGVESRFLDQPPPLPAGPRRLCLVARLSPQKGLYLLLDALALAREQGSRISIDIVGDGDARDGLKLKAEQLGLSEAITFHGAKSGQGVREAIAASHALAMPSFAEGLPVVIMEAMAMGRPVLATAIAGIPELVRPGENGWLVPAGDAHAFAEALLAVEAASDDQLQAMGTRARSAVAALHDANREGERLHRTIAEHMEKRGCDVRD